MPPSTPRRAQEGFPSSGMEIPLLAAQGRIWQPHSAGHDAPERTPLRLPRAQPR